MVATTKIKKRKIVRLLVIYAAGILFLALTDPSRMPVQYLVIPFLWLFVAIFLTVETIVERYIPALTTRRKVVIAGICAALPVLLVVFSSIHQLSVKDLFITVALVICASFYMLRADFIE